MSTGSRDFCWRKGSGLCPVAARSTGAAGGAAHGGRREQPQQLRAQIGRELDRLELLLVQIKAVEAERDAMLARLSQSVDENTRWIRWRCCWG